MEELRDLKRMATNAVEKFDAYDGKDFILPQVFKDNVKSINSNSLTYNEYSAIIETSGNQNGILNIYLPNQWFFIASYFTDYYNELQKYKRYAFMIASRIRIKNLNGGRLNESEMSSLNTLDISSISKSYLVKFITDYSWWGGAKTIDRPDFYVSPILSHARLVNASQSFVAELCAFLSDKQELVKAIIEGEATSIKNNGTELPASNKPTLSANDIFSCGINEYNRLFLSAIRTKPFLLLAGISGTGKSRIVRRLAQATTTEALEKKYCAGYEDGDLEKNRWNLQKPANFEIIQVKPNWHNSLDVVGYLTNIPEPHYVFTPFVEFIAKAWLNPDVPFFLCLDEMNLAPVEEYFAEFLSAIESRSKCDGGYKTDPIIKPFKSFKAKGIELENSMIDDLFASLKPSGVEGTFVTVKDMLINEGMRLPENLIVIGTVNMDETTFSFSRKVLDRAMSFEMNEVDYDNFLEDAADIITKPLQEDASKLLVDRIVNAKEVKDDIDAEFVINYLKAVNEKLDNTPFKLGYRAANEAMLYVSASKNFGQDNIALALDEFTTMKILSRIEGDKIKLKVAENKNSERTILDELEETIKKYLNIKPESADNSTDEQNRAEEEQQEKADAIVAPVKLKSLDKLTRMKEQLERNGFVSYWD